MTLYAPSTYVEFLQAMRMDDSVRHTMGLPRRPPFTIDTIEFECGNCGAPKYGYPNFPCSYCRRKDR